MARLWKRGKLVHSNSMMYEVPGADRSREKATVVPGESGQDKNTSCGRKRGGSRIDSNIYLSDLQRHAKVKDGFSYLVYTILGMSFSLLAVTWMLALTGESGGWEPRWGTTISFLLVCVHYGITAEEGAYISTLWFAHVSLVFLLNGIFGLVWWASKPVDYRDDIGWPGFFCVYLVVGVSYTFAGTYTMKPDFVRCNIIAYYGDKLGEFAIERVVAAFGGILPFQMLTIANSYLSCADARAAIIGGASNISNSNLTFVERIAVKRAVAAKVDAACRYDFLTQAMSENGQLTRPVSSFLLLEARTAMLPSVLPSSWRGSSFWIRELRQRQK